MNVKYRSLIIALILNIVLSIVMAFININLGMIVMLIGILVVPILINVIAILVSQRTLGIGSLLIMSLFNLGYYIVSANAIMHNPQFSELASRFSRENDGFYIHMSSNWLAISQLVFIFLLYFVVSFLISKLLTKRVK